MTNDSQTTPDDDTHDEDIDPLAATTEADVSDGREQKLAPVTDGPLVEDGKN